MLFDANPTPYDVRFSAFGIPVRVHPMFWLIMGLLGDWTLQIGPPYLLLWIACGFVSILIHELGHAVLIRAYGSQVHIAFGGYAQPYDAPPAERWKRIAISFAGPGANFLVVAGLELTHYFVNWGEQSLPVQFVFLILYNINLCWGIFNLLPIWPLDGGRISRELCAGVRLRKPDAPAFCISFVTASVLAAVGLMSATQTLPPQIAELIPIRPGLFGTMFMAMFAVESYQLWQQAQQYSGWDDTDDDTPPWRR